MAPTLRKNSSSDNSSTSKNFNSGEYTVKIPLNSNTSGSLNTVNSITAHSIVEKDIFTYDPRIESSDTGRVIPLVGHRRSKSGSKSLKGSLSLTAESLGSENFAEELGRYVSEMARTDSSSEDVWAQLQQKEADLLLAAELGNALLEKNEELTKQAERLAEQFSSKVEVSQSLN